MDNKGESQSQATMNNTKIPDLKRGNPKKISADKLIPISTSLPSLSILSESSLQRTASSISLENLETNQLDLSKNCSSCVDRKLMNINKFLDRLNGKLAVAEQQRLEKLDWLETKLTIDEIKAKGESEERQAKLKRITEQYEQMDQTIIAKLKSISTLRTKPFRKPINGTSLGADEKKYKLPHQPLIKLIPPNLKFKGRFHRPWKIIGTNICNVFLETAFSNNSSEQYRKFLYKKVIGPAERKADKFLRGIRKSEIRRSKSVNGLNETKEVDLKARSRSTKKKPDDKPKTGAESYSTKMVNTSRENKNKQLQKKTFKMLFQEKEDDVILEEDISKYEDLADDVFGSLPNSFEAFESLSRADRGFYHSVYNRIPTIGNSTPSSHGTVIVSSISSAVEKKPEKLEVEETSPIEEQNYSDDSDFYDQTEFGEDPNSTDRTEATIVTVHHNIRYSADEDSEDSENQNAYLDGHDLPEENLSPDEFPPVEVSNQTMVDGNQDPEDSTQIFEFSAESDEFDENSDIETFNVLAESNTNAAGKGDEDSIDAENDEAFFDYEYGCTGLGTGTYDENYCQVYSQFNEVRDFEPIVDFVEQVAEVQYDDNFKKFDQLSEMNDVEDEAELENSDQGDTTQSVNEETDLTSCDDSYVEEVEPDSDYQEQHHEDISVNNYSKDQERLAENIVAVKFQNNGKFLTETSSSEEVADLAYQCSYTNYWNYDSGWADVSNNEDSSMSALFERIDKTEAEDETEEIQPSLETDWSELERQHFNNSILLCQQDSQSVEVETQNVYFESAESTGVIKNELVPAEVPVPTEDKPPTSTDPNKPKEKKLTDPLLKHRCPISCVRPPVVQKKQDEIMKRLEKRKWFGLVEKYKSPKQSSAESVRLKTETDSTLKKAKNKPTPNCTEPKKLEQKQVVKSPNVELIPEIVKPDIKAKPTKTGPVLNPISGRPIIGIVKADQEMASTEEKTGTWKLLPMKEKEKRLKQARFAGLEAKTAAVPPFNKSSSDFQVQVIDGRIAQTGKIESHKLPIYNVLRGAPVLPGMKAAKLGHKPFKISPNELANAIGEFQWKQFDRFSTATRRKTSDISLHNSSSQQRKNKIGISSILQVSGIKPKFEGTQSRIDYNEEQITRQMIANIIQKDQSYTSYKNRMDQINKYRSNNKSRQEFLMTKLPKPQIPIKQRPLDSYRTQYPLKKPVSRRFTLSALRSSRTVKQVAVKDMPAHLKYGNFNYWLWPTNREGLTTQQDRDMRFKNIKRQNSIFLSGLRSNKIKQ